MTPLVIRLLIEVAELQESPRYRFPIGIENPFKIKTHSFSPKIYKLLICQVKAVSKIIVILALEVSKIKF